MSRKWIRYTEAEMAWLEAHTTLPRAELHSRFVEEFRRDDVTYEHLVGLRKRKGWKTGRDGRFPKGIVPPNKGKKGMPVHPNTRATQFKKGSVPPNVKYAGHERIDGQGYVLINIDETNPHTGYERRYVFKHIHLWQLQNGPLPEGMVLKCLDGNRQNSDPGNWEAVPRALLFRLNGGNGKGKRRTAYDQAPAELKPALLAVAKIEHKIREARRSATRSTTATPAE
jgi:hypothetical protein